VRDFVTLHGETAAEPIRLFLFSFFPSIVEDELAVLQRRTAVELPAETRITFTLCHKLAFLFSNSFFIFPRILFGQSVGKTYSFVIFGCSVGLCELQMCMA
jgi:hypothetical protein